MNLRINMKWIGFLAVAAVFSGASAQPTAIGKLTLYQRLGKIHAIAAVVDDFVDRMGQDRELKNLPAMKEAVRNNHIAGLKYLITEQLCEASGGPQVYTGRSMFEVHKDMIISEKQWKAAGEDLRASLDKFKVPAEEQQEVFAIIQSTKRDIVIKGNRPHLVRATKMKAVGSSESPSLYVRLGQLHPIAALIDDFVNTLLKDPVILSNPKTIEGASHITVPGLKFLIIEQVCEAAGGPQRYTGRTMVEAHKDLGISDKEWSAGGADLIKTMNKFKIAKQEQDELLVIVGSLKPQIVKGG